MKREEQMSFASTGFLSRCLFTRLYEEMDRPHDLGGRMDFGPVVVKPTNRRFTRAGKRPRSVSGSAEHAHD